MPPEEELQDLADFFKIFGDATRLKILNVLLSEEMCVYDIAAMLGDEPVGDFSSAAGPEADGACEEPQGGKDYFLFPCGFPHCNDP